MKATREDLLRALRLSLANSGDCCGFVDQLTVELERLWIETGDEDVSAISRWARTSLDTTPPCPDYGYDMNDCDCDEDADLAEIKSEVAQIRRDIRALTADIARLTRKGN